MQTNTDQGYRFCTRDPCLPRPLRFFVCRDHMAARQTWRPRAPQASSLLQDSNCSDASDVLTSSVKLNTESSPVVSITDHTESAAEQMRRRRFFIMIFLRSFSSCARFD